MISWVAAFGLAVSCLSESVPVEEETINSRKALWLKMIVRWFLHRVLYAVPERFIGIRKPQPREAIGFRLFALLRR